MLPPSMQGYKDNVSGCASETFSHVKTRSCRRTSSTFAKLEGVGLIKVDDAKSEPS